MNDRGKKRRRASTYDDDAGSLWGDSHNGTSGHRYAEVIDELGRKYDALAGKDPEVFWDELVERIDSETRIMLLIYMQHDVQGAKDSILSELLPNMAPYMKAFAIARAMIMNKTKDWRSKLIRRITVSFPFYDHRKHI